MFSRVSEAGSRPVLRRQRFGLSPAAFTGSVFLLELIVTVLAAVVTGIGYHLAIYEAVGEVDKFIGIGALAGLTYCLTFLIQDEYGVESLLEGRRSNGRLLLVWNLAFAALALIGFLTKTTSIFSRAWLIIFYCSGSVTLIALNAILHRSIATLIERGLILPRRLMLVGAPAEVARMEREIADGATGATVVARIVIAQDAIDAADAGDSLEGAVRTARMEGVQDVIISGGGAFAEKAVGAFCLLPVVIHLGASGLVAQFKHARVSRFGRSTTLSLTREPIRPLQAASKRLFDVALASIALILLAPILGLVALAIKLDSKGPVFFRQRRHGYNLGEFRMWKFRTMTTLDDGDTIRQAKQGDDRVTRVGRVLRKYSIDELPQLLNVICGDMSLVGPRPHAVAHDRFFEKRIEKYPRRLNVKPGITGWAQVNGLRGATETDHSMRQRVEHDLYYIDNWSLLLDVYIIALTVLSRKTFLNAY